MSLFIRTIAYVRLFAVSGVIPLAPILAIGHVPAAGGRLPSDERVEPVSEESLPQGGQSSRGTSETPLQGSDAEDSGLSLAELDRTAILGNPKLLKVQDQLETARRKWAQKPEDARIGLQAEQEVRRAEQELIAEKVRVRRNVRTACFVVLVLQRRVESTKELMGTVEQAVNESEGHVDHQQRASGHPLPQHGEHAPSMPELLESAQRRHTVAWRRLAALIGQPNLAPQTLNGTTLPDNPNVTWNQIVQQVLEKSPRISAAAVGVDQSLAALRAAQIGIVLADTADADVGADKTRLSSGRSKTAKTAIGGQTAKVNEAAMKLNAAESILHQVESEVLDKVRRDSHRFADAEYQAHVFSNAIVPNAEKEVEFVEARYETGECDTVDMLIARRAHYHACVSQLTAIRELSAALDELTGIGGEKVQGPVVMRR